MPATPVRSPSEVAALRLAREQEHKTNLIVRLYEKGYLQEEDIAEFTKSSPDGELNEYAIDQLYTRGKVRWTEVKDTANQPLYERLTKDTLSKVFQFPVGIGATLAKTALTSTIPGMPPVSTSPEVEQRVDQFVDTARRSLNQAFGVPDDPVARALWSKDHPYSLALLPEIASFIAISAATRGAGAAANATRLGEIVKASGALGALSRPSTIPKVAGLAFPAIGSVIGAVIAPEGETPIETQENRIRWMMNGAGLGLIPSILSGKWYGASRGIALSELSAITSGTKLGRYFRYMPKLTYGRILGNALEGAAFTASSATLAGRPTLDAISEGVMAGLSWAQIDIGTSYFGQVARWLPMHTKIAEKSMTYLDALGPGGGNAMRKLLQAAPTAALGGALGGAVAGVPGAIGGATMGAAYATHVQASRDYLLHVFGARLPEHVASAAARGQWSKLTAEEIGSVSRTILNMATKETLTEVADAAQANLVKNVLGSGLQFGGYVTERLARMTEIDKELAALELAGQATSVKAVALSAARFQIREEIARRMARYDPLPELVRVQPIWGSRQEPGALEKLLPRIGEKVPGETPIERISRETRVELAKKARATEPGRAVAPAGARAIKRPLALEELANSSSANLANDLSKLEEIASIYGFRVETTGQPGETTLIQLFKGASSKPSIVGRSISAVASRLAKLRDPGIGPYMAAPAIAAPALGFVHSDEDGDIAFLPNSSSMTKTALSALGILGAGMLLAGKGRGGYSKLGVDYLLGRMEKTFIKAGKQDRELLYLLGTDGQIYLGRGKIGELSATFPKSLEEGTAVIVSAHNHARGQLPSVDDVMQVAKYGTLADASGRRMGLIFSNSTQQYTVYRVPTIPLDELKNRMASQAREFRGILLQANAGVLSPEAAIRAQEASLHKIGIEVERGLTRADAVQAIRSNTSFQVAAALAKRAERGSLGTLETVYAGAGAAGGVAGMTVGLLAHKYLSDDPDTYVRWTASSAVLGAVAGMYLSHKFVGGTKLAAPFVLHTVKFADELPRNIASQIVGKSAKDGTLTATVNGITYKGFDAFARMPHDLQVDHFVKRSQAIAQTMNKPASELKQHLLTLASNYAPFSIPHGTLPQMEVALTAAAKRAEMTPTEISSLIRGFLLRIGTPYQQRAVNRNIDLLSLATDLRHPLSTNHFSDLDALRNAMETAEVVWGHIDLPRSIASATTPSARQLLSAVPAIHKELDALVSEANTEAAAAGLRNIGRSFLTTIPGSAIRSSTRFVELANQLAAQGSTALAAKIESVARGIFDTTSGIRTATGALSKRVIEIFDGVDTLAERRIIQSAVEDPTQRATLKGTNPILHEKALAVRNLLNEYAERLGLPSDMRIEDYFPWIYTAKSKREIKEMIANGQVPNPEDYIYPAASDRFPLRKWFAHMEARKGASPLAELRDPLEALELYVHGAERKLYIDNLMQQFPTQFWKDLQAEQPHLTRDLADWYLQTIGRPSRGYLQWINYFDSMGLHLERIERNLPFFNTHHFISDFADRYLTGGASAALPAAIRTFEFTTKIMYSGLSALVNLSQQINSMTDLGVRNVIHAGSLATRGAIAERVPGLGFIDPGAKGRDYLRLLTREGIFSDTTERAIDTLARRIALEQGRTVGLGMGASAVGGILGAGIGAVATEEEGGAQTGMALGAVSASALAVARPQVIRRALLGVRDLGLAHFELVESLNRAATAIAAREAGKAALAGAKQSLFSRLGPGVVAGGAIGYGMTEPGEPAESQLAKVGTGAAIGAAAAGLLRGKGEDMYDRVRRQLDTVAGTSFRTLEQRTAMAEKMGLLAEGFPGAGGAPRLTADAAVAQFGVGGIKNLRALTQDEVLNIYMRQMTELTQFRFGREARGVALNTPIAEILSALQSFTLNQMEFTGGRLKSFLSTVAANPANPEKWDMRIWRYAAFWLGAGAALTAVSRASGSEREESYWLSRIGFGLVPWLVYNESSESWSFVGASQQMAGPFINDLFRAIQFFVRIVTDPVARDNFDKQLDGLIKQILPSVRQVDAADKLLGEMSIKYQVEGLDQLSREVEKATSAMTQPTQTLVGGTP